MSETNISLRLLYNIALRASCEVAKVEWKWLSKKGRRADALALRADERRDKLRKAPVSRK